MVYRPLIKLNETQLEVNMKVNKVVVPVALLMGGVNESKEDTWRDEDWENETFEVGFWTVDLDGRCTVWAVAGNGWRIMDVDEENYG